MFEPPITLVITGTETGTATELGRFTATSEERFTADFLKRHQDKLLFGSDCSADGRGSGVSQANNPAAARLAGKCVARETLSLLKRSTPADVFQKVVWANIHKLLRIPA